MSLFLLLLIPIAVAIISFLASKGEIDIREFGCQIGATVIIVCVPYAIALYSKTADKEIWNGVVASKEKSNVHCCHPYCCRTCESCSTDSKGNTSCHSYCCETCYLHGHDVAWDAYSSNNEHVYGNGCNSPGTSEPARWSIIRIGEPTAVEHSYTNYIKGNPDTLLRRTGAAEKYGPRIPKYPEVTDYYRIDRFLVDDVRLADPVGNNNFLSEINARLGAKKKVNINVILTSVPDQMYLEAVREQWIGGKINDTVVVVGVDKYTLEIKWAGVISWTKNEQIKVDLRNRILDQKILDPHQMLKDIEEEVSSKYEHRRISEFEYLNASITPSTTFKIWLGILSFLASIGMAIFFWVKDPFDNGFRSRYSSNFGRFNRY